MLFLQESCDGNWDTCNHFLRKLKQNRCADIPKEIRKTALNFKTIIKIVPPCIPPIHESFPHQNFAENSWKWQRILLRWCLALNSIQPVTIKYLMPRINLLLQMPLHCHELFSLVPLYKLVKINLCSRFCNIYFQN